jgi:IS5 family transposase
MQGFMTTSQKKHAPRVAYVSQKQLTIAGFETPFSKNLDKNNRWVRLADRIPWDELAGIYLRHFSIKSTGRPPLNPRIVIGSIIIKHMCNLDDRETVAQITENMYMQYFLGYSGFSPEPPFDPSLFVEFRKRLGR